MSVTLTPTNLLGQTRLTRLASDSPAGLWIVSLPWPRAEVGKLTLNGHPTTTLPLGRWPDSNAPKRLLLIADGQNTAPATLSLQPETSRGNEMSPPFSVSSRRVGQSTDGRLPWETHALRLEYAGHFVEISVGLRRSAGIHWWENCGLTLQQESPYCISFEMGGVIPVICEEFDEMMRNPGYRNPLLHKHNWLNGSIYGRLHSNGVCELYLRHINSRFVDDGGDLADALPVVGFRSSGSLPGALPFLGTWEGTPETIALGDVRLDLSEPARLTSARNPGRFETHNDWLVWQPYDGFEIYGGICPEALKGDPFVFRPEEKIFPRGMTRTLRFSLSLSDRSPHIARYAAPSWLHGLCEDFLPEPLLPVEDEYESSLERAKRWIADHTFENGFEDGAVARHGEAPRIINGRRYNEAGWEGETTYAQFLSAWRTGDAAEYFSALRSAYHFVDIAIDHAAKLGRMHGFPDSKISQPMSRMQGCIAAYLETGDPFLRMTAEAVTSNAHWVHKNSWPRLCVGRDACYVRSAVLLYRTFGESFFQRIALEGATDTILSQRPNGSFGDQGGGARLHGWNAYFTKPWMGLLALNGVLDYLEIFPGEKQLHDGVIKFADWLLNERLERPNGKGWAYQHDFNGERRQHDFYTSKWIDLPTSDQWHHETLARLLTYATFATGRIDYFEAWAESHAGVASRPVAIDHEANAILQFIPWVQAKLWNARLSEDGVRFQPPPWLHAFARTATVHTPNGKVNICGAGTPQKASRVRSVGQTEEVMAMSEADSR